MRPGGLRVDIVRTRDWQLRMAVHPHELLRSNDKKLDAARAGMVAITYKSQSPVFGDIPIRTEYDSDVSRYRTRREVVYGDWLAALPEQ